MLLEFSCDTAVLVSVWTQWAIKHTSIQLTIMLIMLPESSNSPNEPQSDERINKAEYTNGMEYCLTMKRNKVVAHDKSWKTLSQTLTENIQKAYYTILFLSSVQNRQIHRESRFVAGRVQSVFLWR